MQRYTKKVVNSLVITIAACLIFAYSVYADTINVYANTDPESSIVGLLIDAMRSDPAYDPHNEYVCARISESQYRIAFGKKLSERCVTYTYTAASYAQPASIVRGSSNSIFVNNNGYYYAGNVTGALRSSRAETYAFQSVLIVAAIVVVLIILFRLYRRTRTNKSSYYTVRG